MSIAVRPFTAVLLTSVALLAAGCTQQTNFPGAGQAMVSQNPALDPPMQMTPDDQASVSSLPASTASSAVVHERMVSVPDPQLAERLSRLERNVGGIQSNVSGLESDVAGLQEDVTFIRPRVEKVEAMEKHFRQLSLELDRINKTYDMGAPVARTKPVTPEVVAAPAPKAVEAKPLPAAVPAKASAPAKKSEPKKAAIAEPLKVRQVRIGEQAGGKTRIVLDTTSPAKISYDIDNGEKILVVELPGASWAAQKSQTLKNSALVSSYSAEGHDGGSRLIIQLKDAAQVVATSRLDPAEGAGYRVFLDLAKK